MCYLHGVRCSVGCDPTRSPRLHSPYDRTNEYSPELPTGLMSGASQYSYVCFTLVSVRRRSGRFTRPCRRRSPSARPWLSRDGGTVRHVESRSPVGEDYLSGRGGGGGGGGGTRARSAGIPPQPVPPRSFFFSPERRGHDGSTKTRTTVHEGPCCYGVLRARRP